MRYLVSFSNAWGGYRVIPTVSKVVRRFTHSTLNLGLDKIRLDFSTNKNLRVTERCQWGAREILKRGKR
jgi:hypothetical protein